MANPPVPTTTSRLAVWALFTLAVAEVVRTALAMGRYEHGIESVTHGNTDPVTPALYLYFLVDHFLPHGVEPSTVAKQAWLAAALVAGATFVAWLYDASRTAQRIDDTSAWAPRWAVAGWFVPFANLAIPYLVVRDVHSASGPRSTVDRISLGEQQEVRSGPLPDTTGALPGTGGALPGAGGPGWDSRPRRAIRPDPDRRVRIGRWWTLVLVTLAFAVLRWLYERATANGGSLHGTQVDMRFVAYPLWTITTILFVRTVNRSVRVIREVRLGLGRHPRVVGGADLVP
ncbi:DUF4328 domain-containing protein [Asanoa sp. NPDC049518]|uniref:DUF4328 domain-containing protein n=1 Tax=unclassified Asanoa TaxID=2685164 RepID=UPI00343F0F47